MGRCTFLAITSCFVIQAALAIAIVPPWQNPDEPQHVMSVRQVLSYGPDYRHDLLDQRSERAILSSMAEHEWWEHYGRPTPVPLPASFADGPARVIRGYFGPPDGGSRLYYRFVAALFQTTGVETVIAQLYVMRVLSVLFTTLALACVWVATRAVLDPLTTFMTTSLMALEPQFVLMAASASPDPAVTLSGAVVWSHALVLLASPALRLGPFLILWVSAIAAFLLRRVGAPLLVMASGVTVAAFVARRIRIPRVAPMRAALVLAALVAVGALAVASDAVRAFDWVLRTPLSLSAASRLFTDISELPRFLAGVFHSFWLTAGWLRYPAPEWWRITVTAICAIAGAGLVTGRMEPTSRRAVVVSAAMLAVQLLAVIGLYFVVLRTGALGKYLFPVMPAIMLLLWVGWRAWFGPARQFAAALSLITVVAFLTTSGWILVILRAYA